MTQVTSRFVLASANPHKVAEMREILSVARPDLELLARPPDVPDVVEDAPTLVGNAVKKARALMIATGEASISDDTGLEVDALDGRPGVHTARFAGPAAKDADNRAALLVALAAVGAHAPSQRRARFRTVVAVCWPDGRVDSVEGACEGRIAETERGAAGFGYDPLFIPVDQNESAHTFAELGEAAKHAVSHRGRALRALAELLGPAS